MREESSGDDVAEKTATGFRHEYGNPNFSSQNVRNDSQLDNFLRARWSDFERPARAQRSTYILYSFLIEFSLFFTSDLPLKGSSRDYKHEEHSM